MTTITYSNARLLDLDAGALTARTSLTLVNGRIAAQGAPEGGEIVDLDGLTLMPGLIDCHFHVVAWQLDLWSNVIAPDSLAALRAATVMEELLGKGFTTVRDLGGADFGLVRGVEEGLIDGPDLIICGKALSMTGGHTDLRPRTDIRPDAMGERLGNMGAIVDGVDEVRRFCRTQIKQGARFIKVMANGGVSSPNDPIDGLQYSDDELRAMVEEAGNANTYVSAHVYSDASIRRCVKLGITSLEHCNLISPETAKLAAEAGCIAIPTLAAYEGLALEGKTFGFGDAEYAKIETVRTGGQNSLKYMRDAGLPMAFGTDLLGQLRKYGGLEFGLLAKVLSPVEILRDMYRAGARLCRMEGEIGTLKPGARGHLIAVRGNPLEDISILGDAAANIPLVIKDGKIRRDRRAAA
ncbi:amidohydrolase family protein [Pseudogemmobacter sonorensis]|uniref:metal-dependent hydrolase family protein n=1 Tax=Pseudogemmobacter sonorensis TaxID=2989681 RepID=UPI0036C6A695